MHRFPPALGSACGGPGTVVFAHLLLAAETPLLLWLEVGTQGGTVVLRSEHGLLSQNSVLQIFDLELQGVNLRRHVTSGQ